MTQHNSDLIAVVGMSCRFPGGAVNLERFWSLLCEGKDAWTDVPPGRFNPAAFHHPSDTNAGTTNHRGGHFLQGDISAFDSGFFAISPAEARAMDPQQRLLMELAYEALENAGLPLESVRGSNTAVYAAIFSRDYDRMMSRELTDVPKYHMTGTGEAIIANRISYCFDLTGPSLTIDTGCSGSMVAIHQACLSLKTNESNMAIVGAANLILAPDMMASMSNLGILNSDGKCYAFDSRGSGYGRGEGAGAIILKRLEDAQANGDHVHCIVRGTGVNQDGRTNGILQPSSDAQQALMRSLYLTSGLDTAAVGYVEAHGTGTAAGDAIETNSISKVFCTDRIAGQPLLVGSVKPNIGHLEAASGIAGFIKTALILEYGLIPPTINVKRLKEDLNLAGGALEILQSLRPWPTYHSSNPRIASVNSFGYGGTNAHCILQATFPELPTKKLVCSTNGYSDSGTVRGSNNSQSLESRGAQPRLLVLSAHSKSSFVSMRSQLLRWIDRHQDDELLFKDLVHTMCCRRSHLPWRGSVIAASCNALPKILNKPLPQQLNKSSQSVQTTFVFTGQGAQWNAMGRELIDQYATFKTSLLESDAVLKLLGCRWSLLTELSYDQATSKVDLSQFAQPMTTAIQLALVDLFSTFGVRPSAVLGHSSGEIAAAYAAGALSRLAAMTVSYHRGSVVEQCVGLNGGMLAVGYGYQAMTEYLSRTQNIHRNKISIACVNSPSSTTLSGDAKAIGGIQAALENDGVFQRRLAVDVAYHSHQMDTASELYRLALADVSFGRPKSSIKFFSSVSATQKLTEFDKGYWVKNLVSTVRFSDALTLLLDDISKERASTLQTCTHAILEIGPHSALKSPVTQTLRQKDASSASVVYVPTLIRSEHAIQTVLKAMGTIFELGQEINFQAINLEEDMQRPPSLVQDLTPYPWDHRESFWHESRPTREFYHRRNPYHDLLGLRMVECAKPTWRHAIRLESLPWLRNHVIEGAVVFPAAGYICMAIESMRQMKDDLEISASIQNIGIQDVIFSKAVVISDLSSTTELQICVHPYSLVNSQGIAGQHTFEISALSNETWSVNCSGMIQLDLARTIDSEQVMSLQNTVLMTEEHDKLNRAIQMCNDVMEVHSFYRLLENRGNCYRGEFAILDDIRFGPNICVARTEAPNISTVIAGHTLRPCLIHPTTLDSLLQPVLPLILQGSSSGAILPVYIKELEISAGASYDAGEKLQVVSELQAHELRSTTTAIDAFRLKNKNEWVRAISIVGGEFRSIGASQETSYEPRDMTYRMECEVDVDAVNSDYLLSGLPQNIQNILDGEKAEVLERAVQVYTEKCLTGLVGEDNSIRGQYKYYYKWLQRYHGSIKHPEEDDADFVLARLDGLGVEGEILSRVGANLPNILIGDKDPLSLLTEDNLLYRMYSDDSTTRNSLHLSTYFRLLCFKQANIKVLEIGAGTGGTTSVLLDSLKHGHEPALARYDFTDISSAFLHRAQTRFEPWSKVVRFEKLDIEQDPEPQGFECGYYDLVVAANVLHATRSIDASLRNVRRLLKPSGKLALIEITRFTPALNFSYGILPGWWNGVNDGRFDSPVLSVNEWHDHLCRNRFRGADVVVNDYEPQLDKTSLIISQAVDYMEESSPQPLLHILHCCKQNPVCNNFSKELHSTLRDRGYRSHLAPWRLNEHDPNAIYIVLDCVAAPLLSISDSARFNLITALLSTATKVLWIAERSFMKEDDTSDAGLLPGFARVARAENQNLRLVTLTYAHEQSHDSLKLRQTICRICDNSFIDTTTKASPELDFTYDDSRLLISRLIPDKKLSEITLKHGQQLDLVEQSFHQDMRPVRLHVEAPGLLQSMNFVPDEAARNLLDPNEVLIEVRACGVNFKDVFIALGQMKDSMTMAGECSGYVVAVGSALGADFQVGDRVCAWNGTPYASHCCVQSCCVQLIPSSMSFVDGASIPVIFTTAYYSLVDVAHLQRDQRVLIHAASGGVGQAAIMISQHIGAEIFALVGSDDKKVLLQDNYGIPGSHIFSSRGKGFKKGLLKLTQGYGVDVVLNSSSGDLLQESWDCVAPIGTFVELGKSGSQQKSQLSMQPFQRHVCFASVDLVLLAKHRPDQMHRVFAAVLSMFKTGHLSLVKPINTMPISNIIEAFRSIQQRKHTGKIVLEAKSDSMVRVRPRYITPVQLHEQGTYVVLGGTGRIGREICRLLIAQGAGHIVILSRQHGDAARHGTLIHRLCLPTERVTLMTCDVTNAETVKHVARRCRESLPPVKGVIHAAMILRDRTLSNMTAHDFETATAPKVAGTTYLREAFKNDDLEFFLTLSSVAAIVGTRGQANYAAGNTFQDALAHTSSRSGTRYVSLSLGVLDAPGLDSKILQERSDFVEREGGIPISMEQAVALINYAISEEVLQRWCRHIVVGLDRHSVTSSAASRIQNPLFNHLPVKCSDDSSVADDEELRENNEINIEKCSSLEQATEIFAPHIIRQISILTTLDVADINLNSPLSNFGLDSLTAVEMKKWLSLKLHAAVATVEISNAPSVTALVKTVAERSELVSGQNEPQSVAQSSDHRGERGQLDAVASASEDKVAELPKLPLPNLEHSMQFWLDSVKCFCSEDEYDATLAKIQRAQTNGSLERQLQSRLQERASDPAVENWQVDLYVAHYWLRNRLPVHPYQTLFVSLLEGPSKLSQATKAAVLAYECFRFKQRVEAREVEPDLLNDQHLDMSSLSSIFDTVRMPGHEQDTVSVHKITDYMVVLRRDHYFKVSFKQVQGNVGFADVESALQYILDLELQPASSAAVLLADRRDGWYRTRKLLQEVSKSNKDLVETIDKAAFLVCLDEQSPTSPSDRYNQYLFGDPRNRWCDKSLQFIVCPNGAAAYVCSHSNFDGVTTQKLVESLNSGIARYAVLQEENGGSQQSSLVPHEQFMEHHTFATSEVLSNHIKRVQHDFDAGKPTYAYVHHHHTKFGGRAFRANRATPNAGFQVLIQLASRLFFGHQVPSWETVSQRMFRQGRVDLMQTALPAVTAFCTLMQEKGQDTRPAAATKEDRRASFHAAAVALSTTLSRVGRGEGFSRHLTALRAVLREDEPVPDLFTDPTYVKTLPQKLRTDCARLDPLLSEGGIVMPDREGVWVHFYVEDEGCRFVVVATDGRAEAFVRKLEEASELMWEVLDG